MKRVLIPLIVAVLTTWEAFVGYCQTTTNMPEPPVLSGPAVVAWDFLTQEGSTNWMGTGYGIYDQGSKTFGAGVGIFYSISDYIATGLRFDWLNNQTWMPSGNVQLQAPVTIMGKVKATPFGFTGIATPISGQGQNNGTVTGIAGIGLAIGITEKIDVVGDVEKWGNFPGEQYRFGLLYKF